MCFDQPRIPKHRILKESYTYSLSGRRRRSRRGMFVRSLIAVLSLLILLVMAAEYSRTSSLQSIDKPEHNTEVRLQ
ncbi:hypothetical protein KOI40_05740 [Aestuariicella sp. G3-2]|uniref:hypothetical protein n=1 Tax=Pseudomaricurvus albidus TaxID=2842452 RepID=UPI001C0C9242|nr:hypothetical protein [Aestuariicella albida]MBU3069314.1 hypothetical protein [Aestuariicella albida]